MIRLLVAARHEIARSGPCAQVLVLTSYSHRSLVREAFEAGASGYVLKGSSPATLLDPVRATHHGESPMSPDVEPLLAQYVGNRAREGRRVAR